MNTVFYLSSLFNLKKLQKNRASYYKPPRVRLPIPTPTHPLLQIYTVTESPDYLGEHTGTFRHMSTVTNTPRLENKIANVHSPGTWPPVCQIPDCALENTNRRPKRVINVMKRVHISSCVMHIRQWLSFKHPEWTSQPRLSFLPNTDIYRGLAKISGKERPERGRTRGRTGWMTVKSKNN